MTDSSASVSNEASTSRDSDQGPPDLVLRWVLPAAKPGARVTAVVGWLLFSLCSALAHFHGVGLVVELAASALVGLLLYGFLRARQENMSLTVQGRRVTYTGYWGKRVADLAGGRIVSVPVQVRNTTYPEQRWWILLDRDGVAKLKLNTAVWHAEGAGNGLEALRVRLGVHVEEVEDGERMTAAQVEAAYPGALSSWEAPPTKWGIWLAVGVIGVGTIIVLIVQAATK